MAAKNIAPRFTQNQQSLWHSLAVGLYYRACAAQGLREPLVYTWAELDLERKLYWQRKAKEELAAALVEGLL
ncbi:MAG: hypothetical protein RB191_02155 [Terriglobia bacterium]|nr:hypothetical protein [Terriglobia bacterium]